ncbi:transglutaminase-like domain-containing protein [Paraferrimonas haliotis]|uniref:transglutaminase-like domain-containing protein n=1 Tax=Paraferrimonas haliotis TaxID=2013866 RepID=UPI000BA97094|nr:transglutaminase-like domain-containing protein [Paraferrimonas haliotis]
MDADEVRLLTQATEYFDYDTESVSELAKQLRALSPQQTAVNIYYHVRDSYPYNPYGVVLGPQSLRASHCLEKGEGYCLPKAALMIALCRANGIPARLGLADVKNHLSSEKLIRLLRTEVFTMHGYASIFVEGRWLKATPTFNQSLCDKYKIKPLEFDGTKDAIFQEFTEDGSKHMQYLTDFGCYNDVPVDFIFQNFHKHYPHLMQGFGVTTGLDSGPMEQESCAR